jgi:hypothetical protein
MDIVAMEYIGFSAFSFHACAYVVKLQMANTITIGVYH